MKAAYVELKPEWDFALCNTIATFLRDRGLDVNVCTPQKGSKVIMWTFPEFADDKFILRIMEEVEHACASAHGYWYAKHQIEQYLEIWERECTKNALSSLVWRWMASKNIQLCLSIGGVTREPDELRKTFLELGKDNVELLRENKELRKELEKYKQKQNQ